MRNGSEILFPSGAIIHSEFFVCVYWFCLNNIAFGGEFAIGKGAWLMIDIACKAAVRMRGVDIELSNANRVFCYSFVGMCIWCEFVERPVFAESEFCAAVAEE